MKNLTEYFALALIAQAKNKPHGFQADLARKANVSRSIVSDIVNMRKYGSEEVRRSIAKALGWDYEDFLNYGKSIKENTEYKPENFASSIDGSKNHLVIPFHEKVVLKTLGDGLTAVPDAKEKKPPFLLNHSFLGQYGCNDFLVAFPYKESEMEPIIPAESVLIVDTSKKQFTKNELFLITSTKNIYGYTVRRAQSFKDFITFVAPADKNNFEVIDKGLWRRRVVGRVVGFILVKIINPSAK